MVLPTNLKDKLDYIYNRIQVSATRSGRNPQEIKLVAITKKFPVQIWEEAIKINLNTLGESRIQEAVKKTENFSKRDKIKLHFIGHLQSNKVQKAVDIFDVIQTVDSIGLAKKINRTCKENKKKQRIYLQVNIGYDQKKYGVSAKKATTLAQEITKMENLNLEGIMTIPPQNISIKELRTIYNKTSKLRDKIYIKINKCCKYVSMGMSNDYEIAIEEGATHIRIGSGLFGERPI